MSGNFSELDLMDTRSIIEYLARTRFSASVISGVLRDNKQGEVRVSTIVKGDKAEVELLKMDVNKQLDQHINKSDLEERHSWTDQKINIEPLIVYIKYKQRIMRFLNVVHQEKSPR